MALAAVAMSCNKVEEPQTPAEEPAAPVVEEGIPFTINAGFTTKTVNDGLSTKWVAGDQISVFNAESGEAFASNGAFTIAEADLEDGTFTGTLASELTADAYDWIGVYPYDEDNASLDAMELTFGASALTVTPESKALLAGETLPLFGKTESVAKADAVAIKLGILASAVKVAVKNPTASAYTLSKLAITFPEAVAGVFSAELTGAAPAYTETNGVFSTVTLTLSEAAEIAAGATINLYFPIKPFAPESGDKISIKFNDETDAIQIAASEFKAGVIKTINASIPLPTFKVGLKQYGAEGDGETITVSTGLQAEVESCPEWISITPGASSAEFVFAANNDDLNARLGKVILKNGTDNAVIYVAQAAKGCKCFYESFATGSLSDDWKASWTPTCSSNGYTEIEGGDGYVEHVAPLFYQGLKIRQKYNDSGSCNKFICTLDLKADGAECGIIGFNTFGYDGTSYDILTNQNYIAFASATAGETSGGYFCFHVNGDHNGFEANAMDGWNCDSVSEFIRIEMSNVERDGSGVGGDWGGKYVWTTEADASGVLQSKALVLKGGMWWWNDSVQLGKQYGYFGVFSKFGKGTIKNFVLSYQDNE